jgi:hypothetical protein
MADKETYNPAEAMLADIGVKLRDIEEKQNIVKDRVLLIGENLISEKEETSQLINDIKTDVVRINEDVRRLKMAIERIVDDSNNFVRKNEFEILQRQFQMFQPLELARISDVESMISKALRKQKQ